MNLMRLGIQSRKTGIKPKENITKDEYDMEDIDEFFNDSTWAASTDDKNDKRKEDFKKKRTLGPGRQRFSKPDSNKSVLPLSRYDVPRDTQEASSGAKLQNTDVPPSPRQEEIGLVNADPSFDLDLMDDYDANILDGPNSYLPSDERKPERPNSRNDSSQTSPNSSSDKKSQDSYSRLTKNMALNRANKGIASGMYHDDQTADFSSSSDEFASGVAIEESQDSNTDNSQNPHGYTPTQKIRKISDSLPSPPPEGLRRSKRTKIAPLAYWRNEKIVYTRARENDVNPDNTLIRDIRKVPLQEIVEVIHVPEKPQKDLKIKGNQKAKRRPRSSVTVEKKTDKEEVFEYDSDPEIEGSEWFKQKSLELDIFDDNENPTSRIIAWAPNGGEFQLPLPSEEGLLADENFKVASLFDTDLNNLAAGLLDFPPEGFKSLRTTGNSLFIFHVARGLVEVTINSKKFVVTKGCSFEIPKYNIYSFKNIGHGSARLFFVQCQISTS